MHSLKKIGLSLLLITFALGLGGCGSMEEKRETAFSQTITLYKNAMRWRGPGDQKPFFVHPEQANLPSEYGLRVVDIQMTSQAIPVSETERLITAKLYYLKESSQAIQIVDDSQKWVWTGEEEGWRRSNPMPTPR